MKYVKRMPPEFGVLYVKDATSRDREITETQDFITWAANEGSKLLI